MLHDPEHFEEWELEVRATDQKAAERKCEEIAVNNPLTQVLLVTQATKTPYSNTYRFICWFRSETTPNDSDSDISKGN